MTAPAHGLPALGAGGLRTPTEGSAPAVGSHAPAAGAQPPVVGGTGRGPDAALAAALAARVRDVADFPSPGVMFKDIGPVLSDAGLFQAVVDALGAHARALGATLVAGVEARGFLVGGPVALAAGVGFLPVRKAGKLPGDIHARAYDLEYGSATLEVQAGIVPAGARVLVVDDVLATGGTASAAAELVRTAGGEPLGLAVLIELSALGGRAQVAPLPVHALLSA